MNVGSNCQITSNIHIQNFILMHSFLNQACPGFKNGFYFDVPQLEVLKMAAQKVMPPTLPGYFAMAHS